MALVLVVVLVVSALLLAGVMASDAGHSAEAAPRIRHEDTTPVDEQEDPAAIEANKWITRPTVVSECV